MLRPLNALLAAALLLTTTSSCGVAAIYHHTIQPLDLNAHGLDLGSDHKSRSTVRVDPSAYVSVEFGAAGIGDVARHNDFVSIDHADLEVLSIMGVYTQRFVHIYGVRALPAVQEPAASE